MAGSPAARGRSRRRSPRALRLASCALVTPRPASRPSSASARGSVRPRAEWARARLRGQAGARGPWLAAGRRPLPSMRATAAGCVEWPPLRSRSQAAAAAAAPAGRGTWRSPLLGVAAARGLGAAATWTRSFARQAGPRGSAPASAGSTQGTAPRGACGRGAGRGVARVAWGGVVDRVRGRRGRRRCGPAGGRARASRRAVRSLCAGGPFLSPLCVAARGLIHCWTLPSLQRLSSAGFSGTGLGNLPVHLAGGS